MRSFGRPVLESAGSLTQWPPRHDQAWLCTVRLPLGWGILCAFPIFFYCSMSGNGRDGNRVSNGFDSSPNLRLSLWQSTLSKVYKIYRKKFFWSDFCQIHLSGFINFDICKCGGDYLYRVNLRHDLFCNEIKSSKRCPHIDSEINEDSSKRIIKLLKSSRNRFVINFSVV